MASNWHKLTQEKMIQEYKVEGYEVKKERKIGFDSKVTRETQFKQVDIVAEKRNEIILIEIEDLEKKERELGVGYVELGGILFLSYLFAKLNPDKKVILLLIFRDNILNSRKNNINKIKDEFKNICNHLIIEIGEEK